MSATKPDDRKTVTRSQIRAALERAYRANYGMYDTQDHYAGLIEDAAGKAIASLEAAFDEVFAIADLDDEQ